MMVGAMGCDGRFRLGHALYYGRQEQVAMNVKEKEGERTPLVGVATSEEHVAEREAQKNISSSQILWSGTHTTDQFLLLYQGTPEITGEVNGAITQRESLTTISRNF